MRDRGRIAGFTLVEMLVVITITIILMGLIFAPIVQTFNFTRQATAMVQAQDTARSTLELISRELSQAMFVYDNSNSPIIFPAENESGTIIEHLALYGKVDMILPKMLMHCNNPDTNQHPDGQSRNYERGDEAWPPCPVCGSTDVEMRPKQPLTPDSRIVRYFVGLADNEPPNAFRDWTEVGSPLNGFILYRAEFDPYDENLVKQVSGQPQLDDPNFFYDRDTAPGGNPYWQNWKAIAKPIGPQVDTDLVILSLNPAGDVIEGITPSVRFQLTQMTNDTFSPSHITDEGAETPSSIPSVFRATYSAWGTSLGTFTPDIYNVTLIRRESSTTTWYRTVWEPSGDPNGHLCIYKYDSSGSRSMQFDITSYLQTGSFSPLSQPDVAFTVDPVRGEARFDFPASDIINSQEIEAMNDRVRNNWGTGAGTPVRMHRIDMFGGLGSASPYQPRVVPGSEIVIGPDMTPGLAPNQVRMVRYARVPFNLGDPGRNQYKIDYGMNDTTGERVGWIIFSPAYDEIIPSSTSSGGAAIPSSIDISYKYQLNHDGDVVIGNYATKTLMQVTLGIRYYDRNSGKLTPMELTNKVRLRNLMR